MSSDDKEMTIVMFGSTGDLAKKYLWPSISALVAKNKISKPDLIGVAYRDRSAAEFKDLITAASGKDDWWQSSTYVSGDLNKHEIYNRIQQEIDKKDRHLIVIVLSVAPEYFMDIAKGMEESGLLEKCRDVDHELRIMIEKPFGTDLESARKLDLEFCSRFKSEEIYRIDHYQGKSMLQNLYTLRFANPWFSAGWNNQYISKIEVNFLETNDSSERGEFYDQIGAWRDVGQNHLLQLLASGMMTKPEDPSTESFHEARNKFLESLEIQDPDTWQQGQYQSYKDTKGVETDSTTETFFRIKLQSNLERWRNIPIILQGGKSTGERRTSITFYTCPKLYGEDLGDTELTFQATPNEQAVIELWGQDNSHESKLEKHTYTFSYATPKTDAYERVFYSAITGDQQWFTSSAEVRSQWKLADQVHEQLKTKELEIYPDNTLLNTYE